MRKIYLIRHGRVLASGESRCISETDLHLDETGRFQAERLRSWAEDLPITAIYSSPLLRSAQTARFMSGGRLPVLVREGLREMSVGEWENLTFSEIRARFPVEYAARGEHIGTVAPPGGESFHKAGERLLSCLGAILEESEGGIAVVAHAGVNRGALAAIMGLDPDSVTKIPQPTGCISVIEYDGDGCFTALSTGQKPDVCPPEFEIVRLLDDMGVSPEIRAHGEAVAKKAEKLAARSGTQTDTALLSATCRLHDIAKGRDDHAAEGAMLLRREGYPAVADIIAQHHDIKPGAGAEAEFLYLADKLVRGVESVSLEARFVASKEKCRTPEAIAAWERRYNDAIEIAQKYNLDTGG